MPHYGTVFNIQRYTINDGPGIRTEVFLKGCPLGCLWCSNPESQKEFREVGVYPSKCIGFDKCGYCADACAENCISFKDNIIVSVNRERCTSCMKCAEVCPSVAIKEWGQKMSVSEVMDIIKKDIPYYKKSSGGVTFSGGEPLIQSGFLLELLKECRHFGIDTCVESALCVDREEIERILPYTDLMIADIKMMDSALHSKYTGSGNEKILENFIWLCKSNAVPVIVRIPVIPKVNDNIKNAEQTADFILNELDNNIRVLQLLKYMPLGEEKYRSLDIDYPMSDKVYNKDAFDKRLIGIQKYFADRGINCIIGTTTKETDK